MIIPTFERTTVEPELTQEQIQAIPQVLDRVERGVVQVGSNPVSRYFNKAWAGLALERFEETQTLVEVGDEAELVVGIVLKRSLRRFIANAAGQLIVRKQESVVPAEQREIGLLQGLIAAMTPNETSDRVRLT